MYVCLHACVSACVHVVCMQICIYVGKTSLIPTGTQLSPMAPQSCLHVAAATPCAMALTGWPNQVRVANGSQALGDIGIFSFQHVKTATADQGRKSL